MNCEDGSSKAEGEMSPLEHISNKYKKRFQIEKLKLSNYENKFIMTRSILVFNIHKSGAV